MELRDATLADLYGEIHRRSGVYEGTVKFFQEECERLREQLRVAHALVGELTPTS